MSYIIHIYDTCRSDAPPRVPYTRGHLAEAKAMLGSRGRRAAGIRRLLEDRFAPSTRRAAAARRRTLRTLVKSAKVAFLPITVDSYNVVAAALKAGGPHTHTHTHTPTHTHTGKDQERRGSLNSSQGGVLYVCSRMIRTLLFLLPVH